MSRIEEAMEKARQRRETGGADVMPPKTEPATPLLNLRKAERIEIASPRLVAANDYNLPIAEEYRKLKSIIVQLTQRTQSPSTLMVTSSIGGEGKSVTSLNLALSLAQGYDHSVLLVDADLRNPSISRYLGLKPQVGLGDCLTDDLDLTDALIDTGLGSLTFLPAGKNVVNPVELLSSQRMKELLAKMQKYFADGYIIFDTTPVLPFADARVIGSMVDGTVFVVKEDGPSVKNVSSALESLQNTHLLGIVYNKATTSGLGGGYHYYYYDYDYRRRDGAGNQVPAKQGLFSRFFRPTTGKHP